MKNESISTKERKRLEKLSADIRNKLWRDDAARIEEERRHLIGKFFKTKNNYSCPEKPSDYWTLYSAVIAVCGREVSVVQFEKDKNGDIMLRCGDRFGGVHALATEITEDEFLKAAKKLKSNIDSLIMKAVKK